METFSLQAISIHKKITEKSSLVGNNSNDETVTHSDLLHNERKNISRHQCVRKCTKAILWNTN